MIELWTAEQVEELRRLYSNNSNRDIAALFGVSTRRILWKAKQLGLRKSNEHMSSLDDIQIRRLLGNKPFIRRPVGSHQISKEGILQRKITDDKIAKSKRWQSVHVIVWEESNGPVPPRHILVFRPGMRTNVLEEITLDRLECITVAENILRNSCNNLSPELQEITRLRGQLTKQINRRIKDGQEH